MFESFADALFPAQMRFIWGILFDLAPIWLPLLLGFGLTMLWMNYVRSKYIAEQQYVLLEILLPREIDKSPMAMETALASLHSTSSETTFLDRWWLGKVRPWFSLEYVSLGGSVHLYVWTRKFFARHVENVLYAQYPSIEVKEVDDYTRSFNFDLDHYDLFGCDFKLVDSTAVPIKTYVDYGLDRDPKEEYKIDPLANLFEFLGSIPPGSFVWYQILFQGHKKGLPMPGSTILKTNLRTIAAAQIKKINESPEQIETRSDGTTIKKLSKDQENIISGINRKQSKLLYDVGIRGIYITPKNSTDPMYVPYFLSAWKQFGSPGANGFVPTRYLADFDYPWQDYRNIRQNKSRFKLFDAYRRRSWFHPPYKTPNFVLNSEELATLWHFPGAVVKTPTMPRIESTREGAPSNLPI